MLDAIVEFPDERLARTILKKRTNIKIVMNRETCDFAVYAEKTVSGGS